MADLCPLCGTRFVHWMTTPIDPKKETPCANGSLFRCPNCSFGMVLPRPAPEEIGAFYDLENYYTHGRSHFADGGVRTLWDRMRLHLAWRMDFGEVLSPETAQGLLKGRPSDVCDIGCGSGQFALELKKLGHRVVGVELDREAIRVAEDQGLAVHYGSVESLPESVAGRRFDLVVMSHVLEHVLDPGQALRTVKALLRPGGRFVCVVPNNASAGLADAGLAWEPLDVPRHLNFFVPANLVTLCEGAGLIPSRLFYGGYCRQFSNEWINTERRIYEAIVRHGGVPGPTLRKNSKARAWWLLAKSVFAKNPAKYDQVGVVAEAESLSVQASASSEGTDQADSSSPFPSRRTRGRRGNRF